MMPPSHLKLYCGPSDDISKASLLEQDTNDDCVTVSVGEVLPLIADAVASKRTWLTDFEHDDITISRDLYEVLSAYQFFSRPSA